MKGLDSDLQISRLDILPDDGRRRGGETCAPLAVMRCNSCAEVFYAKHYEDHWCFRNEVKRDGSMRSTRQMQDTRGRRGGKESPCSVYPTIHPDPECSSVGDPRGLEAMLDIKPVVSKIWRCPHMFYRLFSRMKGAGSGPVSKTQRRTPQSYRPGSR